MDCGRAFALAHLKVIEAAYGREVAVGYASGHAWGGGEFILNNYGAKAAYDLLQNLADNAADSVLVRGKA